MNGSSALGRTSGTTDAHIPVPRLPMTSGTLQMSTNSILAGASIAVPASVIVAEAETIIEDAYIRANYTIVPERAIDDFVKTYKTRMSRRSPKNYVNVDLPMMDEDSDW